MFEFNSTIDDIALRPLAQGYKKVTPNIVDQGISNFFSNLGDIVVLANNLLQLKGNQALEDANRLFINSTFGMFGLFDLATPLGLEKHNEDFGQTLGYWGIGSGYYVVLPLLGSTSTRDVFRLPVDGFINPLNFVDPSSHQFALRALDIVQTRAEILTVERALGGAAIDEYSFLKEAYLQRRRSLVEDGNPDSASATEDDLFDALDDASSAAGPATQ